MNNEQLEDLKQFFMDNDINPSDAVVGMTEMIGILLQSFSVSADARAKATDLLNAIEVMLHPQ